MLSACTTPFCYIIRIRRLLYILFNARHYLFARVKLIVRIIYGAHLFYVICIYERRGFRTLVLHFVIVFFLYLLHIQSERGPQWHVHILWFNIHVRNKTCIEYTQYYIQVKKKMEFRQRKYEKLVL